MTSTPLLGLFVFILLVGLGVQVVYVFLCTFLAIFLLSFYWSRARITIRLDQTHLYLQDKVWKEEVPLKDVVSMSFGGVLPRDSGYYLRLRKGNLIVIPLMNDYLGFEKEMEKRADLTLVGESVMNLLQFRIMAPKNRRWTRKGLPYQKTSVLDSLDPSYLEPRHATAFLCLIGFLLFVCGLLSVTIGSN